MENPQQQLLELCGNFIKHVSDCTIGSGQTDNLVNDYLCDEYDKLAARIIATKPQFGDPDLAKTSSKADPFEVQPRQLRVLTSNTSKTLGLSSDEKEVAILDLSARLQSHEGM